MRFAKIVSYVLHPVFMPLLGVYIIFNCGLYLSELPLEYKRFVYMLVSLCSVILPLTIIPALYLFKNIQSITLDDRRERLLPIFFTAICYYVAYHIISKVSPVRILNMYLLACVLAVFTVFLISTFWKLSLHMTGIGGICGLITVLSIAFSVDMTIFLSTAILLTGFIATSRLMLKAHVPFQLIAGFVLGYAVVGVTMLPVILR